MKINNVAETGSLSIPSSVGERDQIPTELNVGVGDSRLHDRLEAYATREARITNPREASIYSSLSISEVSLKI